MINWKTFIERHLRMKTMIFIEEYFKKKGIQEPTIPMICEITEEEMNEFSPFLSVVHIHELLVFQQIHK